MTLPQADDAAPRPGFQPESAAGRAAFAALLARSFGGSADERARRLARLRRGELLLAGTGAAIEAGTIARRRRVSLGGRFVPAIELAALAVDPGQRESGHGRALLAEAARRGAQGGAGIALLRSTRTGLYARAGFAPVGSTWLATLAPRGFQLERGAGAETLGVRRAVPEDRAALRALERRCARARTGAWLSTAQGRAQWLSNGVDAFVLEGPRGIEGLVSWTLKFETAILLRVQAYLARTARANERMLELVLSGASVVREVRWRLSPHDPAALAFAEGRARFERRATILARVLDVAAAFGRRGYRRGIAARHEIAIEDDLVPENRGAWTLAIQDGRGRLERGGSGAITLDARAASGLAAGAGGLGWLARGGMRSDGARAAGFLRLCADCELPAWNTTFAS